MGAKRAIAAKMLHDATIHLYGYRGFDSAELNVARSILMDAERRVRNGFGPVPNQDVDNLLAIEHEYAKN